MSESIFKNPALIAHLVKRIQEKYPGKQIGKTIVQKMLYLLSRDGVLNVDYSMHYYGPYSQKIASEIDFAESTDIIEIKWVDNKGYFISSNTDKFESIIEAEKNYVDVIVDRFGGFNAKELSIIATALYLRDNFEIDDTKIVDSVHNIKEQYSAQEIRSILQKSGILH
jgi:uncharacterized protein YwgA